MKMQSFAAAIVTLSLVAATAWTPGSKPITKIDKRAGLKPVPQYAGTPKSELGGRAFIEAVEKLGSWERDDKVVEAVTEGKVPEAMKSFRHLKYKTVSDASVPVLSKPHTVELWVLPDYLCVGRDDDFIRMPVGPLAAQKMADALDCCLPTTYLVDRIDEAAEGRIDIFPFRPVGGRNMEPFCFQDSEFAIEAVMKAYGYHLGQFISGLKKDIVLTSAIENDPRYERSVAIYGWHHPDGHPQQPLFIRHGNFYMDYSHGVRLIWHIVKVDGVECELRDLLTDPQRYRLVSDEALPLKHAGYNWQKPWHFEGK